MPSYYMYSCILSPYIYAIKWSGADHGGGSRAVSKTAKAPDQGKKRQASENTTTRHRTATRKQKEHHSSEAIGRPTEPNLDSHLKSKIGFGASECLQVFYSSDRGYQWDLDKRCGRRSAPSYQ